MADLTSNFDPRPPARQTGPLPTELVAEQRLADYYPVYNIELAPNHRGRFQCTLVISTVLGVSDKTDN